MLEDVLLSLMPLVHLHILLEGDYDGTVKLHKVLRAHEKCLRSLVWDERIAPRLELLGGTNTLSYNHLDLEVVRFDFYELT